MIYGIVEEGDGSAVKIGYSGTSIIKRAESLQIGNWRRLICVAVMPGAYADESRMHEEFTHYHIRGEWFRCVGDVAQWVGRWRVGPDTRLEHTEDEIRARGHERDAVAALALAQHKREREAEEVNQRSRRPRYRVPSRELAEMRTTSPKPEAPGFVWRGRERKW